MAQRFLIAAKCALVSKAFQAQLAQITRRAPTKSWRMPGVCKGRHPTRCSISVLFKRRSLPGMLPILR
jgi:hypothetical protein